MSDDQLSAADLASMTPRDIDEARRTGRLDRLLGVPQADTDLLNRARNGGRLDRADCKRLSELDHPDLIVAARDDDRINYTEETAS